MKVKLIHNPLKHWAEEVEKKLRKMLRSAGYKVVRRGADATICIGGDGTILYANHKDRLEGNVLGIGSTHSYICQLQRKEWRKAPKKLRDGTVTVQMLELITGRKKFGVINDVVVHTPDYRVMDMVLEIDGKKKSFSGDGIIISSALGSTSYAYSAGGRKLRPTDKRTEVVPIAPYKREFKPVVLKQGTVTISCKRPAALIVDGIFVKKLKKNEKVKVKKDGVLKLYRGVGFYG